MVHEADNIYAEKNRLTKAMKLADVLGPVIKSTCQLESDDGVADIAQRLDDEAWKLATKRAGVNPPSTKTKALVIALLEERYSSEDPFAGIPTMEDPTNARQRKVDILFDSDDRCDMATVPPLETQMYGGRE